MIRIHCILYKAEYSKIKTAWESGVMKKTHQLGEFSSFTILSYYWTGTNLLG